MEIEKDSGGIKFRNESHKATINILYTATWLRDKYQLKVKKFDISVQQFNILRILMGAYPKPSTILFLKEKMIDRSSDASRIIERLRKKEFVERVTSEKDRRAVDIKITKKGITLLENLDKETSKYFDGLYKNITKEEQIQLNSLLDKMRG